MKHPQGPQDDPAHIIYYKAMYIFFKRKDQSVYLSTYRLGNILVTDDII